MSFQLIPQVCAAAWTGECVGTGDASNVATITGIQCLIENIVRPLPAMIALVAVFMIIFAGFRIVTAGSDPKALTSAWASFTYAVVGLVLLSAIWLVLVLIENFTGAQVTQFGI